MVRRVRADMVEETRSKLIAAARQAFAEKGFANTSMDEFTAEVGLTRGALYHHFGDKKGLLAAVVEQIDAEMNERLFVISDTTTDIWSGFRNRCRAYLEMAQEPEIQRIVLQDARAVFGGSSQVSQEYCIISMSSMLNDLMQANIIVQANPEALARLIDGSLMNAAFWIAEESEGAGENRLSQALQGLDLLLRGLLV